MKATNGLDVIGRPENVRLSENFPSISALKSANGHFDCPAQVLIPFICSRDVPCFVPKGKFRFPTKPDPRIGRPKTPPTSSHPFFDQLKVQSVPKPFWVVLRIWNGLGVNHLQ
jgi:hypothetical protein